MKLEIKIKKGQQINKLSIVNTLLKYMEEHFKVVTNEKASCSEKMFGGNKITVAKQDLKVKIIIKQTKKRTIAKNATKLHS